MTGAYSQFLKHILISNMVHKDPQIWPIFMDFQIYCSCDIIDFIVQFQSINIA